MLKSEPGNLGGGINMLNSELETQSSDILSLELGNLRVELGTLS